MKKLVSLISALTMCAVMAAPIASSAATMSEPKTSDKAEIIFSYTPASTYTITIPDTQDYAFDTPIVFGAENVCLKEDANITVSAVGEKGALTFTNKEGVADTIAYTINADETPLVSAGNTEGSKTFQINLGDTSKAKYANAYTDKITFTVNVSDVQAESVKSVSEAPAE